MSRYTVRSYGVRWYVDDSYAGLIQPRTIMSKTALTEAEAKVIAWALNAVAEGLRLEAYGRAGCVSVYGGPAERVAP